jgi:hypothetical protein
MKMLGGILLAAVLLFAPAGLMSQTRGGGKRQDQNTRSVQGTVTNASDALVNGAVVQLKNIKTLQIRSFITKEGGAYYFQGLSPDVDYELKADYQGESSGTKTLSSFDSKKLSYINLKLNKK